MPEIDEEGLISWQGMATFFIIWMINLAIFFIGLVKVLVYGDPIMSSDTDTQNELVKQKKRAEQEFDNGNSSAAYVEYTKCLKIFGLILPTSRFDCFTLTTWQFVRMCIHRVWIGRWLSRKAGGLFCSEIQRVRALESAREMALILHRLNQLHLSTKITDSHGFMMSLFAINMAEVASGIMPAEHMLDIYVTAALRVKRSYPKYLQFFSRYYLSKAKQIANISCDKIPEKFQWAFTPYGYKFVTTHPYKLDAPTETNENNLFSHVANRAEPISYLMKDYREHLLEKALQCLCGAGNGKNDVNSVKQVKSTDATPNLSPSQISDVLCYTQLLNGCEYLSCER